MKEQVIEILKHITGMDNITEDMSFMSNIVMTSVDVIKLAYYIQDKLGIDSIPTEMVYEIKTVKELIDVVESYR